MSVFVHELGHALYLESIGKSWDLRASLTSGFAVHTDERLARSRLANFGRAGFALQTLIGTGLSMFEATRYSDFTKGWVAVNAVEILSYNGRRHEDGGDFDLIERGGGRSDMEFAAFSLISTNNMLRLENGWLPFMIQPPVATQIDFSDYAPSLQHTTGNPALVMHNPQRCINNTANRIQCFAITDEILCRTLD